jgi:hypothetical protein
MLRASHYIALRKKEDWLEICHYDRARWIHADGNAEEEENLAWTLRAVQGGFIQT